MTNQTEITKMYNENYPYVLNFLKHKYSSMDEETAIGFVDEAFAKAFNSIEEFDEQRATFRTWIVTIVKNLIIDDYRKNRNMQYCNIESFVNEDGVETFQIPDNNSYNSVEGFEIAQAIKVALSNLPLKYKKIAELYFVKGYKMLEISELMGLSIECIKLRIFYCRRLLQTSLKELR